MFTNLLHQLKLHEAEAEGDDAERERLMELAGRPSFTDNDVLNKPAPSYHQTALGNPHQCTELYTQGPPPGQGGSCIFQTPVANGQPFCPMIPELEAAAVELIEAQLLSLLKGQGSSLTIEYNEHNSIYKTAKQVYDDPEPLTSREPHVEWVSPEERVIALETNSVWVLDWYPDTPVGHFTVAASTLKAVLLYALKDSQ